MSNFEANASRRRGQFEGFGGGGGAVHHRPYPRSGRGVLPFLNGRRFGAQPSQTSVSRKRRWLRRTAVLTVLVAAVVVVDRDRWVWSSLVPSSAVPSASSFASPPSAIDVLAEKHREVAANERKPRRRSDNNERTDHLLTVPRFDLSSLSSANRADGSQRPVLLQGWAGAPVDWQRRSFLAKAGSFPQYLKDTSGRPRRRSAGDHAGTDTDTDTESCILPTSEIVRLLDNDSNNNLLLATDSAENEPFLTALRTDYTTPSFLRRIDGLQNLSVGREQQSQPFRRQNESWLAQVEGRRMWWFLPPTVSPPQTVDVCRYLTGETTAPNNAVSVLQKSGEIVWFPQNWYYATCTLDNWTVSVGAQSGPTTGQAGSKLDESHKFSDEEIASTIRDCVGTDMSDTDSPRPQAHGRKLTAEQRQQPNNDKRVVGNNGDWQWFDGDLNAYYNSLEKDIDRNPDDINSYAVHRWMGKPGNTQEHYSIIDRAIATYVTSSALLTLRVLDGGCGLGSGLMWMEQHHPQWQLTGHTVSEEQYKFINDRLPKHKFVVNLRSFDDLDASTQYDVIYSVEALIHSTNLATTIAEWSHHLAPGGVIIVIDDFVSVGTDKNEEGLQEFARSWLANCLFTTSDLANVGRTHGLTLAESRDLGAEYGIVKVNYRNHKPNIKPFGGRVHQGWMGSKWRQRLMVEGKLTYNLMVLQKPADDVKTG